MCGGAFPPTLYRLDLKTAFNMAILQFFKAGFLALCINLQATFTAGFFKMPSASVVTMVPAIRAAK